MIDVKPLTMKASQRSHALLNVILVVAVTGVCIFQIGRDFDAGCRVKIMDMFAETQWRNHTINFMLLGSVDKLLRALTRNTDNVPLILKIKGVGPVGHSSFHNLKLLHFFRTAETTGFNYLRN